MGLCPSFPLLAAEGGEYSKREKGSHTVELSSEAIVAQINTTREGSVWDILDIKLLSASKDKVVASRLFAWRRLGCAGGVHRIARYRTQHRCH